MRPPLRRLPSGLRLSEPQVRALCVLQVWPALWAAQVDLALTLLMTTGEARMVLASLAGRTPALVEQQEGFWRVTDAGWTAGWDGLREVWAQRGSRARRRRELAAASRGGERC